MPLQLKKIKVDLNTGSQIFKDGDLLFNIDAEAWAQGTRNGVNIDTPNKEGGPYDENNAKYWSEQAQGYATEAETAVLTGNLAQEFDQNESYSIGDYVIYGTPEGTFYRFTSNHAAGDPWDINQVEACKVSDEITGMQNNINNFSNVTSNIKNLQKGLSDLEEDFSYFPVKVESFQFSKINGISLSSPVTSIVREVGETIGSIEFIYTINKTLYQNQQDELRLNESQQLGTGASSSEGTIIKNNQYTITAQRTFRLTAKDHGSPHKDPNTDFKEVTISFGNEVYWGAATLPENLNEAFIAELANQNRELTDKKGRNITVDASGGKYIWYAVPHSFGLCTFKNGGFTGGFESPSQVTVTNGQNVNVVYDVYRSTQQSLDVTVNIS